MKTVPTLNYLAAQLAANTLGLDIAYVAETEQAPALKTPSPGHPHGRRGIDGRSSPRRSPGSGRGSSPELRIGSPLESARRMSNRFSARFLREGESASAGKAGSDCNKENEGLGVVSSTKASRVSPPSRRSSRGHPISPPASLHRQPAPAQQQSIRRLYPSANQASRILTPFSQHGPAYESGTIRSIGRPRGLSLASSLLSCDSWDDLPAAIEAATSPNVAIPAVASDLQLATSPARTLPVKDPTADFHTEESLNKRHSRCSINALSDDTTYGTMTAQEAVAATADAQRRAQVLDEEYASAIAADSSEDWTRSSPLASPSPMRETSPFARTRHVSISSFWQPSPEANKVLPPAQPRAHPSPEPVLPVVVAVPKRKVTMPGSRPPMPDFAHLDNAASTALPPVVDKKFKNKTGLQVDTAKAMLQEADDQVSPLRGQSSSNTHHGLVHGAKLRLPPGSSAPSSALLPPTTPSTESPRRPIRRMLRTASGGGGTARSSAPSESWDDDFGEPAQTTTEKTLAVPASIRRSQGTLRSHLWHLRQFAELVAELKEVCAWVRTKTTFSMTVEQGSCMAEAEAIIALAEQGGDELTAEVDTTLSPFVDPAAVLQHAQILASILAPTAGKVRADGRPKSMDTRIRLDGDVLAVLNEKCRLLLDVLDGRDMAQAGAASLSSPLKLADRPLNRPDTNQLDRQGEADAWLAEAEDGDDDALWT